MKATYKRPKWTLWMILSLVGVLLSFLLSACDLPDVPSADAKTKLILLDVTSGGAGKYGMTTESYWQDPNKEGVTIRCFHHQDGNGFTADPQNCDKFDNPTDVPAGGKYLLAANEGSGQVTQLVWLSTNGKMYICNYDQTFWNNVTGSETGCTLFPRPSQVKSFSLLISLNSGSGIHAQSFWQNRDGTVTVCDHDKVGTGLLGLGGSVFGKVTGCNPMTIPSNLFPSGLRNPQLRGVTSDSSRPWESYWEDSQGFVFRCQHDHNSDFWNGDTIGAATQCKYWYTPASW